MSNSPSLSRRPFVRHALIGWETSNGGGTSEHIPPPLDNSAEGVYWLPVCTCEASAFYKKNSTNSYPLPRRLLLPTTILFLYICKWNSLKNVFLPFFNCIVVQFSQFTRSGSTVHVRNYDPLPPSPRVQLYRRERGAERNRRKSSEIALKLRYPANLAQHSASKHR